MKCRSCGAPIIWTRIKDSGKWMPLNPERIHYKEDPAGDLILVEWETGEIHRGSLDIQSEKTGHISHFATCPEAENHRKQKNNNKPEQIAFEV